jgi:hypothetical protein
VRDLKQSRGLKRGWERGVFFLATACIALLVLLSTAQLVHTHANGHEDPDCALCYSAHQTVQASAHVALHLTVYEVAAVVFIWDTNRPSHNEILLPLNRPPPAYPVSA